MYFVVGLLVLLAGINLYLNITNRQHSDDVQNKQADQLTSLTRRMNSSDERYAQLSARFQVTTEKLGLTQTELSRARTLAANIQRQQQAAVEQLNQAIAQKASSDQLNKAQADANAKIGGLSTDLAGTKKDLQSTRDELTGALSGTKTELTGAIARTHDELVALAHKTDRDYFEFNVNRKQNQRVGSMGIALAKTNPKRNQYTVTLTFDDKPHTYKDKTANEPLFFYPNGAQSALELVVNKVGKDTVAGYVSAPKGFFPTAQNVLGARPGA
jgi:chromosome segregation ATPase